MLNNRKLLFSWELLSKLASKRENITGHYKLSVWLLNQPINQQNKYVTNQPTIILLSLST